MREEDKIGGKSTVMERSEEGDEWKEGRQKEKEMEVVICLHTTSSDCHV